MQPSTISLARILELSVPVSWQEAVAVTCLADEASLTTGISATPANCLITTDGTVQLNGRRNGHIPTRGAAYALLAALIDGQSAPPEIREFVVQQAAASDDALADFLSEEDTPPADKRHLDLAFFARPNPEAEVAALAARSLAAEAGAGTDIGRLRTSIQQTTTATAVAVRPPEPREHPRDITAEWWWPLALRGLAAGAIVIVLGTTAGRIWQALASVAASGYATGVEAHEPGEAVAAAEPAAPPVEAALAAGPSELDLRPTGVDSGPTEPAILRPPAPEAPRPAAAAPPPRRATNSAPRETAPAAPRAPSPAAGLVPPAASVGGPIAVAGDPDTLSTATTDASRPATPSLTSAAPPAPAPAPAAPEAEEALPARDAGANAVYSPADTDVEPPELVRPQLASEAPIDTEPSSAYIEILVNERGEVARVRLLATTSTLNDRMLVAAAKAWVFRPAMRDGRPVRYLLRLPVTR